MDLESHLARCPGTWRGAAPASNSSLESLKATAQIQLPADYVRFLSISNGGEGDLAIEPGWVAFWPAEHILELNREYEITALAPGLFGFGSNGGGELLAFDTRGGVPYPVVAVPFIPLDLSHVIRVADDFASFVSVVGVSAPAA